MPLDGSVEGDFVACGAVGMGERTVEPSVATAEAAACELSRTVDMVDMEVRGKVRPRLR